MIKFGMVSYTEIENAPVSLKSWIWEYFGFPVTVENGSRKGHKDQTVSKSVPF